MDSDRLTKVETLLGVVIENQESSKERQHKVANEVMLISARQAAIEDKIDDHAKLTPRVESLEKSRAQVLTGWQLTKWMFYIMGGFFTASLAIGDKVAKLPIWSAVK